jgi:hypothetical protein
VTCMESLPRKAELDLEAADPEEVDGKMAVAALKLAANPEAATLLRIGEPVPREHLRPHALAAIGQGPHGEPYVLTLTDALRLSLWKRPDADTPQRSFPPIATGAAAAPAVAECLPLEPIDLAEFLSRPVPPVPWLWRHWIARGDLALIVADPKVGKSLLALGLALATRKGTAFLGDPCERGRVGILDFENPREEVHRRLAAFGLGPDDVEGLMYVHMPTFDLSSPDSTALLRGLILEHALDLLIIDSIRRAAPGLEENDSAAVSAVFSPLRRLSVETGASIAAIHHARKRHADNSTDAGQMVRGSGDLVASVDTLLYLRAKEAGTFTLEHAASRRGIPHESILVRIEAEDEDRIELVSDGPVARADDKVEAMLARIIEALRESGGYLERPVLALRIDTDGRNSTFTRALKLGWQRNQLAKEEGAVGKPTVYSLAEELRT